MSQVSNANFHLLGWAAWPWGNDNMTTYVDASYNLTLDGKPYMMPVSPWFFTNLPGYDKNWLWRGDDLWYERWQEVWSFMPEFVQIISWNDFGESHYIGPLDDRQYDAFTIGDAPYNYVENMPHDGWRLHLPYVIDTYTKGTASFNVESLVVWFRTSLANACGTGNTTGNTASQLQLEFPPSEVAQDRVFFSALLTESADMTVLYGPNSYQVSWDYIPDGGVGIYHGSIPMDTVSGEWGLIISRGDTTVINYQVPQQVYDSCTDGITNWNAWVGSYSAGLDDGGFPPRTLSEQVCTQGWGAGNFDGLCNFTCKYGYVSLPFFNIKNSIPWRTED